MCEAASWSHVDRTTWVSGLWCVLCSLWSVNIAVLSRFNLLSVKLLTFREDVCSWLEQWPCSNQGIIPNVGYTRRITGTSQREESDRILNIPLKYTS